jgi:hypothetical protein
MAAAVSRPGLLRRIFVRPLTLALVGPARLVLTAAGVLSLGGRTIDAPVWSRPWRA